jgi:hypothetical protein
VIADAQPLGTCLLDHDLHVLDVGDGQPRPVHVIAEGAAAFVASLAGAVWLGVRAPASTPLLSGASFAVMPFGAVGGDTALARLGRELVVTLSTSLDGVGDLRAAEATTVLALVPEAWPLERAAAIAERLGVGRLVHGTLARVGGEVRLD